MVLAAYPLPPAWRGWFAWPEQAMRESSREISVVCCDLRGFTRYAAAHPSSPVLAVLRECYDDVGVEVVAFGATIKDLR